MTDLSLSEKKRLLLEARAARIGTEGPAENKYDLSGLETRTNIRKKSKKVSRNRFNRLQRSNTF